MKDLNRRDFLTVGGAAAALAVTGTESRAADQKPAGSVRFCLNTSTLMGQKLSLDELVTIAADAGYDGIEPWLREIQAYKESGKSLADLKKRIADAGLRVESAIGFANWIVDDPARRAKGIEDLKRDMDLVAATGGTHIAAPPAGANGADAEKIDLLVVAERYHAILEVGREHGVIPQVEVWGPSKNLSRLGEAVMVAIESGHPDACVLPDVYHVFRGGSPFDGIKLLSAAALHAFHFNDYPAEPARQQQTDAHRVYPGDGAAPWEQIIGDLKSIGFRGAASLELFNRDYWQQDPREVAKTGLAKMKAVFE